MGMKPTLGKPRAEGLAAFVAAAIMALACPLSVGAEQALHAGVGGQGSGLLKVDSRVEKTEDDELAMRVHIAQRQGASAAGHNANLIPAPIVIYGEAVPPGSIAGLARMSGREQDEPAKDVAVRGYANPTDKMRSLADGIYRQQRDRIAAAGGNPDIVPRPILVP